MPTVAEVFRQYGPAYREHYQDRMLPRQRETMDAIETCRTLAQGGHVYQCPSCETLVYSYHSCKNRHCPTCQHDETEAWIARRTAELVPATYYLVTFTLPNELRALARSQQKIVYSLMFQAAAAALQKLAHDPAYLGGRLGMIAVLHTWTTQLHYHPHIHLLTPGVGIAPDGGRWVTAQHEDWLVPVRALSVIFRAKMAAGLKKAALLATIDRRVWKKSWVVHCLPVGSGRPALIYLAAYIHRTAIANHRLTALNDGMVSFTARPSGSDHDPTHAAPAPKVTITITAEEFIHRFLQHVLPPSFIKVRYYGFLSSSGRAAFAALKSLLGSISAPAVPTTSPASATGSDDANQPVAPKELRCPHCGELLQLLMIIARPGRAPP